MTLVVVEAVFLGMFFAADRFGANPEAARLAVEWRHGMRGDWPLYMPGFVGLTLAIAWWWRTTTGHYRAGVGAISLIIATAIGVLLAPHMTLAVQHVISVNGSVESALNVRAVSGRAIVLGAFTILCWMLFIGCAIVAVQRRRPLFLVGAAPGFATLHCIREGAAAEVVQTWISRAGSKEPAAWFSLAMIPVAAWAVWRIARHKGW